MGKIMHTLHVHKMVNQWRCRYKQIKEKGFKTAKQKKGEAAKIFTFTCARGQEKKTDPVISTPVKCKLLFHKFVELVYFCFEL